MKIKGPIVLQGAMKSEINKLIENISNPQKKTIDNYEFWLGELENYPVIVAKTEIGLINATMATIIALKEFKPCMVINSGMAGGFGTKIHKNDIIVGIDCLNINSFETEYSEKGQDSNPQMWKIKTFQDGQDKFEKIEADEDLIKTIKSIDNNYIYGTIGSGDCWNKEVDRIEWFNKNYNVLCEDMETIAVYKVCKNYNIPTVGIRIISNNEVLNEKYEKNSADTIQNIVIDICKKIINEE